MLSDLTPPEHLQENPEEGVLEIPYQRLSEQALAGIIEEFISREGTDYGDYDFSFENKKQQVLRQIIRGTAIILFDPSAQTCQLELAVNVPSHYRKLMS